MWFTMFMNDVKEYFFLSGKKHSYKTKPQNIPKECSISMYKSQISNDFTENFSLPKVNL